MITLMLAWRKLQSHLAKVKTNFLQIMVKHKGVIWVINITPKLEDSHLVLIYLNFYHSRNSRLGWMSDDLCLVSRSVAMFPDIFHGV